MINCTEILDQSPQPLILIYIIFVIFEIFQTIFNLKFDAYFSNRNVNRESRRRHHSSTSGNPSNNNNNSISKSRKQQGEYPTRRSNESPTTTQRYTQATIMDDSHLYEQQKHSDQSYWKKDCNNKGKNTTIKNKKNIFNGVFQSKLKL